MVELETVEDAEVVYNTYQKQKLFILDNAVDVKYSRYDHLSCPEEEHTSQCVLLVSIISRDFSTLSLRHFYAVHLSHSNIER